MTATIRRYLDSPLDMRYLAAAIISAVLLLAVAAPAEAQSAQSRRTEVVKQLGAQYDEMQAAMGVTSGGQVIEVFTTSDGSTWTMVLTRPDGTSSVIAVGDTWIRR